MQDDDAYEREYAEALRTCRPMYVGYPDGISRDETGRFNSRRDGIDLGKIVPYDPEPYRVRVSQKEKSDGTGW